MIIMVVMMVMTIMMTVMMITKIFKLVLFNSVLKNLICFPSWLISQPTMNKRVE